MLKTIFIVGPTGVGKTEVAFNLAQNYNGALISADSIQVYKGLDVTSGKDLPKTAKYSPLPKFKDGYNSGFYIDRSIPIFLLDVVESITPFSVSSFHQLASDAIAHILSQNKLPIIVGGTGLYIKSLLDPIQTSSIKPDHRLREKLVKLSVLQLQKLLPPEKLKTFNDSDKNNPRRLIRAIEISKQGTGDSVQGIEKIDQKFKSLVIGLMCSREVLKQRIDARVDARLKQGAMEEATTLFENFDNLAPQIKDANGYKQLFEYLQNKLSLEEAIYRWKISEYRHAKNQMTWFQKYGNVEWFDIEKVKIRKETEKRIEEYLL